jgi:hypothetical protein
MTPGLWRGVEVEGGTREARFDPHPPKNKRPLAHTPGFGSHMGFEILRPCAVTEIYVSHLPDLSSTIAVLQACLVHFWRFRAQIRPWTCVCCPFRSEDPCHPGGEWYYPGLWVHCLHDCTLWLYALKSERQPDEESGRLDWS